MATSEGPHRAITLTNETEEFLAELFDALWDRYRQRVAYVQSYESMIRGAGATFVNDHIAFRTLACQQPLTGIAGLSRIFEALGYIPAGCYHFADKHLGAIHYQHPNSDFPKLFISELKVWELSRQTQHIVESLIETHRDPIAGAVLADLYRLTDCSGSRRQELLDTLVRHIQELPWNLPERSDVETVNAESQYAAWVMVHGYNVNHFTSLINSHGTEALDDIEKTIAALIAAGVPMKSSVEGEHGSKLRQSATEAVTIDVNVAESGEPTTMPWTYAYFELAERGEVIDAVTGKHSRFEGFLGPQATNLFEMTRVADGGQK